MSESEEVKRLANIKSKIEKKIRDLEDEISSLKSILSIVDAQLAAKSFKPAEAIPLAPPVEIPTEFKEVLPLKSREGKVIADLHVSEHVAKIVPSKGITLNVTVPPFRSFLIARVLDAMTAKDRAETEAGKLPRDKVFGYKLVQDGDMLKELIFWNYRTQARLREIRSSTRWTFERMLEKSSVA